MNPTEKIKAATLIAMFAMCGTSISAQDTAEEIFIADPTIMPWKGKYYLTGTSDREGTRTFRVLESDDLKTWHPKGVNLSVGDHSFGTKGFWAPQYFRKKRGKWLFFYTANEQIAVAESKKVWGKFAQKDIRGIDESEHNIDPFLFKDDDGKLYLYHVRFDNGNYLWVGEFDTKKRSFKGGTLKRCFGLSQPWERTDSEPKATVMEGPTVIKKEGKYYMFYSANHFLSPDYAVGYAVADSPYGPWHKADDNPMLHSRMVGERGSGHGDVFESEDGKLYYVYHVHYSADRPTPRRTRIVPLKCEKREDGTYRFAIDKENVIVPVVKQEKR